MEEVVDFETWLANYKPIPTQFVAVFDPSTGKVKSVGPDHAFVGEINQVPIDKELAESIIAAEIQIEKCMIDINSGTLEIAELRSLAKLDDLLHRIISIEYSDIEKPDIFLTYDKNAKELRIQLSEEFGGTKKLQTEFVPRKFVWDGNTEMNFLITDYNDPNLIFEMHGVKLNDLVGKDVVLENVSYEKFSVYTRRLFKNYVIEYK